MSLRFPDRIFTSYFLAQESRALGEQLLRQKSPSSSSQSPAGVDRDRYQNLHPNLLEVLEARPLSRRQFWTDELLGQGLGSPLNRSRDQKMLIHWVNQLQLEPGLPIFLFEDLEGFMQVSSTFQDVYRWRDAQGYVQGDAYHDYVVAHLSPDKTTLIYQNMAPTEGARVFLRKLQYEQLILVSALDELSVLRTPEDFDKVGVDILDRVADELGVHEKGQGFYITSSDTLLMNPKTLLPPLQSALIASVHMQNSEKFDHPHVYIKLENQGLVIDEAPEHGSQDKALADLLIAYKFVTATERYLLESIQTVEDLKKQKEKSKSYLAQIARGFGVKEGEFFFIYGVRGLGTHWHRGAPLKGTLKLTTDLDRVEIEQGPYYAAYQLGELNVRFDHASTEAMTELGLELVEGTQTMEFDVESSQSRDTLNLALSFDKSNILQSLQEYLERLKGELVEFIDYPRAYTAFLWVDRLLEYPETEEWETVFDLIKVGEGETLEERLRDGLIQEFGLEDIENFSRDTNLGTSPFGENAHRSHRMRGKRK